MTINNRMPHKAEDEALRAEILQGVVEAASVVLGAERAKRAVTGADGIRQKDFLRLQEAVDRGWWNLMHDDTI